MTQHCTCMSHMYCQIHNPAPVYTPVSPLPGNTLQALPSGLFVPELEQPVLSQGEFVSAEEGTIFNLVPTSNRTLLIITPDTPKIQITILNVVPYIQEVLLVGETGQTFTQTIEWEPTVRVNGVTGRDTLVKTAVKSIHMIRTMGQNWIVI